MGSRQCRIFSCNQSWSTCQDGLLAAGYQWLPGHLGLHRSPAGPLGNKTEMHRLAVGYPEFLLLGSGISYTGPKNTSMARTLRKKQGQPVFLTPDPVFLTPNLFFWPLDLFVWPLDLFVWPLDLFAWPLGMVAWPLTASSWPLGLVFLAAALPSFRAGGRCKTVWVWKSSASASWLVAILWRCAAVWLRVFGNCAGCAKLRAAGRI